MAQFVGVSFRRQGQIYFFLATPFVLSMYDKVLVKTEEGIGFGEIVAMRDELPEGIDPDTVKPIYRPVTGEDTEIWEENKTLAREARRFCQQCVSRLGLGMKLVEVEIYFDKSKMIFYFTAPGRVDFRELVKDLVRNYRTRIELRQIGVRHETQMIGALGNCGQVCCCRRYLRRFEPVTIKMAKDQNLFLNPAKISGVCGRLLCCLAYEKDNYANFQHRAPKLGRKYTTSQGAMKTLRTNMFRDSVTVLTEAGDELEFTLADWSAIVVTDQQRSAVPEDVQEDVPEELAELMDPELRGRPARQDRRGGKPYRQDNRPPRDNRSRGPRPSNRSEQKPPQVVEQTGGSHKSDQDGAAPSGQPDPSVSRPDAVKGRGEGNRQPAARGEGAAPQREPQDSRNKDRRRRSGPPRKGPRRRPSKNSNQN